MRTKCVLAWAAAAGLLLTGLGINRLGAADDKVPSIEEIMKKVNKRKAGLHDNIGEALKMGTVDWESVQEKSKQYAALADFLGKNDPPKGSKASWEKLTKTYATDAKALYAAAEKKDKAAVSAAHRKLQGECMGCHRAHREM
jgi:cytochrome c556